MGRILGLDEAAVARLSPQRLKPRAGTRVGVTVGSKETAEFQRQSRQFAQAWGGAFHLADGRNHFDILDDLRSGELLKFAIQIARTHDDPSQKRDGSLWRQLRAQRLMPILTLDSVDHGLRVADIFAESGFSTFELTLRTTNAIAAIAAIVKRHPASMSAPARLLTRDQLQAAADAGAVFAVSPGADTELLKIAAAGPLPFIPGVGTVSEAMTASDHWLRSLEVLPGGSRGRRAVPESHRRSAAGLAFLPDRRHHRAAGAFSTWRSPMSSPSAAPGSRPTL